jgi:pimeloyl-ACP methyl ester carboxylesterase
MPTLVANGAHDVMTSSYNTWAMTQRLPNATAILYSNVGHGFLFQHPHTFGDHVVQFLR